MKILVISRRLNFRQSAPKCNAYLASALAGLGHDTSVLASVIDSDADQKLREAKVNIHKVPKLSAQKQLSPLLYTLYAQKLKNKLSADIVFGNGYTLFDDVTWIHLPRLATMARLGSKNWKSYTGIAFEKLLYRTSKLLLTPSSMVADDLNKIYGVSRNKIVVNPHGVDVEYYKSIAEKRKNITNAENEVHLLFVGAEPLRKGFHLLLRSLARIKAHTNFKLIAVGFHPDQKLRLLMEKLGLNGMVKFEGIVPTEKLNNLYQFSDIFVLPSLYDPFSIATLEAMASGLPVIVSRYTGIKDILCNWHDSVLVDPFDIAEFSETLRVLINDDKLRRKLGRNARRTAEKFTWEKVTQRILKIFNSTIWDANPNLIKT